MCRGFGVGDQSVAMAGLGIKEVVRYPLHVPDAVDVHDEEKLAQVRPGGYGDPVFWDKRYSDAAKKGVEESFEWYMAWEHCASQCCTSLVSAPILLLTCEIFWQWRRCCCQL